MWPGKPLCRLCERPAADGGHQAAEMDKEKFSEWCLVYLGHTLADELKDDDLICCFCVWDARFLDEHERGEMRDLCWWPKESMTCSRKQTLFENYEVKQCWVPLKKLVEAKAVEETTSEVIANGRGVKNGKLSLICIYCNKNKSLSNVKGNQILVKHIKSEHRNIAIRCNFFSQCPNYFLNTDDRDEHIKKVHFKRKEVKVKVCIYCSQEFISRKNFTSHISRIHAKTFIKCKVFSCGEYFKTQSDLDFHNLGHRALEDKKKFACEMCSYRGLSKGHLFKHIQSQHLKSKNPIKCQLCEKVFENEFKLQRHLSYDHKFKYCSSCGSKFTVARFERHFSKNTVCNQCGHSFKCCVLLRKHKIECNPYECDFCLKLFSKKSFLKYHVNRHHVSKISKNVDEFQGRFECKVCNKYIANKKNLKLHCARLHSNSRRIFECSHCTMKYFGKRSMARHLANVHNLIEKKYHCKDCDRQFCSRFELKDHVTRTHSKKIIQCPICKIHILSHILRMHMIYKHGIR
ncbi:zinc finger Y-chromosomal protein 1-like [Neocloeon triangulifer]|uniref:zinc finger Y-chromosomal protein 1-like n=1 Tax=Neocloeon triangulifer TaxID=2078957 RepID=UPI00286EB50A|nr:zinc finger Y-chromosomal protein 1-like [Neocloeon triangulifer]